MLAALLGGCSDGLIEMPHGPTPQTPGSPGSPGMPGVPGVPGVPGLPGLPENPGPETPKPACTDKKAGVSEARRLTRTEYVNTVRALLRDETIVMPELALDGMYAYFAGNNFSPVSALAANRYREAAEALSEKVVPKLGTLVSCAGTANDTACASKFIKELGARAYRRPLKASEQTAYETLYAGLRSGGHDHPQGLRWVLATMLQSPWFLNHLELGDATKREGDLVPLTAYELASRLSYFYWHSMPDDALFAAAASGALLTTEGLTAQARRLLEDPRGRRVVVEFHAQVLELEKLSQLTKDATFFPNFTTQMRASMAHETERFIEHVYWEGDATLSTLLTADFGFVDQSLAGIYGVSGVTGTELKKVSFPAGQRSGLLTQASLMALNAHVDQNSPVFRGKLIRERLLCQSLAAPPPGVETKVEAPKPGSTTRERYAQHSTDPYCAGCHRMMDPIGFGFENYDALGAYRTTEGGKPVDASGEIINGGEVSGPFVGAVALGQKLAKSEMVHTCTVKQWLGYATQREPQKLDACSTERLATDFFRSGGDLKALLAAIPLSDAFRYRAPVALEESCR